VDRTQSPLVTYLTWQIYQRTGNRDLLALAYPVLKENNEWIRRVRDGNGNGLLEFGSSDVGQGLYKGTKLAAKDESFMDNSPIHDEAEWNEASRTLNCEDVGLNSLVCLDSEMLALIATELGRDASSHSAHAAQLRAQISKELWDSRRNIFANRLWTGKFVASVGPTSFFPLLAGAASAEQQRHLLDHLRDPSMFGGAPGLPSVARSDPALRDNVYWRGRIWPILNWLTWNGLKRCGAEQEADRLRTISLELFFQSWRDRRLAPENYHPETGEGLDQPDTDPFYSWTALLPYMALG
jgi:putative isomerase